jgi:hypothetical protein
MGSIITSIVNGYWKESKTKESTAPAAAGSARDMLSTGARTCASSGAATDPKQRWKQKTVLRLMIHPKEIR